MQQRKIRKYEIVDITGNDHARISSLTGRNLRFVAVLEEGPGGPRFSRRQFAKAHQAKVYKRFVLIRLAKIFCQPAVDAAELGRQLFGDETADEAIQRIKEDLRV